LSSIARSQVNKVFKLINDLNQEARWIRETYRLSEIEIPKGRGLPLSKDSTAAILSFEEREKNMVELIRMTLQGKWWT
jgi:hypothetical protein